MRGGERLSGSSRVVSASRTGRRRVRQRDPMRHLKHCHPPSQPTEPHPAPKTQTHISPRHLPGDALRQTAFAMKVPGNWPLRLRDLPGANHYQPSGSSYRLAALPPAADPKFGRIGPPLTNSLPPRSLGPTPFSPPDDQRLVRSRPPPTERQLVPAHRPCRLRGGTSLSAAKGVVCATGVPGRPRSGSLSAPTHRVPQRLAAISSGNHARPFSIPVITRLLTCAPARSKT